ncbi:PD-(D/E)XK nuclease domain-containing protein [Thomasclavelia cocleata]
MNFDGLKDDIIRLLSGEKVNIQTTSFQNDMTSFKSKDDVFTLLVHLGYLAYNQDTKEVCIPNKEVIDSFVQSVKNSSWGKTTTALINSDELLKATWNLNEEKVAYYIEQAHLETSLLQYNDENALSYTISLAYYRSRDFYTIVKELPAGKGFADMVFIPKGDKPAMIIELKWNQEVETAITQIKGKEYYFGLEKYLDNLLLIGITYDKDSKKYICQIEKYEG